MNRRQFTLSTGVALTSLFTDLLASDKRKVQTPLPLTEKMPVMFVGHGSPMNAITRNQYHNSWRRLGEQLPLPAAILVISAHWRSIGVTRVMSNPEPETIHDFSGFADILYEQQYPASGAPDAAQLTYQLLTDQSVSASPIPVTLDNAQGFDHGTWSILLAMYPQAAVPVYQLSIDIQKPSPFHYRIGRQLADLRHRGVLIIGSGNLIHNLAADSLPGNMPYDWALSLESYLVKALERHNDRPVIDALTRKAGLMKLAHPTLEHYSPLLYVLGAKDSSDQLEFFNAGFSRSSISMRSVLYTAG